jgi:hypothetical protein
MAWNNSPNQVFSIGGSGFTSGSRSNFALNSAYVHLTSGAGYGFRFRAQASGALQEFYTLLDQTTGTRGNISLQCRLYDGNNAAAIARPSGTLLATATNASLPASDDRWTRWQFPSPATLTENNVYWLVIDNLAAVPATDFPGIINGLNFRHSNRMANDVPIASWFSTTNGFSTAGTGGGIVGVYVVDGIAYGNPFSLAVTSPNTNNTLRHGALFANELSKFKYWGVSIDSVAATTNLLEIHDASVAPGSGVLYSETIPTALAQSTQGTLLVPDADVSGAGEFIVSVSATSNTSTPAALQIEGYSDYPTLFDQFFDGITCCKAVQEVAGTWQEIPGTMCRLSMNISEIKASSGSGGLPVGRLISGGV